MMKMKLFKKIKDILTMTSGREGGLLEKYKIGDKIMALFHRINETKKTTIVYVTHDLDYANQAQRKIRSTCQRDARGT